MENLFASSEMASGYAAHRPAVHPEVMRKVAGRLGSATFQRGLDVGCGSGISTQALAPFVTHAVGLEPAESMLRLARQNQLLSSGVAGLAESLPFASGTFELLTAAGSLNYADDIPSFFREARRVLARSGALAVYDFSPGRKILGDGRLEGWFDEFMTRYPRARDNARPLDPQTLAAQASDCLTLTWSEHFQIPLVLDHAFYVNYMMTETNVAYAVRTGAAKKAEIREWCEATLAPVFAGQPRPILFEGYAALFQHPAGYKR